MIVGFSITDYKGYKKEAIEYIRRVCILESPDIATNIVAAGPGINIYARDLDVEDLQAQPFESSPIETQDGKLLLVNMVNFSLELNYNGNTLRMVPTQFINILPEEAAQFSEYIRQGLVRTIPGLGKGGKSWILKEGKWDDSGVWIDTDTWRDGDGK